MQTRQKDNTEEARAINYYLDALKQKVYNYQWEIKQKRIEIGINFRFGFTHCKKLIQNRFNPSKLSC